MIDDSDELDEIGLSISGKGITRRDFLKYCGLVAAALGLDASFIPKIAQAAIDPSLRRPVVWLHFAECTGCTESFLRHPTISDVILTNLSIDYHETLMAPSGENAHKSLADAVNAYSGEFLCVCEGAIPTAKNGIYGMIGNKTMLQIAREVCPKAKAVISYGTCASYGGLPAAAGNVTGAKSVHRALGGYPTINVSGCPPNPFNLVTTLMSCIALDSFPILDDKGRPDFAYAANNHSQCYLREPVAQFACQRGLGCRGPETSNNCPSQMFNEGTTFPMATFAPCYGCSEPRFWDNGKFFNYSGTRGWGDGSKQY